MRHAVQLKAAGGAVTVEHFDPARAGVLDAIRRELAPLDPSALSAELYDVNVYSSEGHFVEHKDTPRGGDMLGTLVVCLPSRFSGGALVVRHRGAEETFDWGRAITAQTEPTRLHWAAFFGDVDHRIDTIWSGYRVTLSYILRRGADARITAAPRASRSQLLQGKLEAALADRWFMVAGGVLAFPCFHQYSQEGAFQRNGKLKTAAHLKGRDADVAAVALAGGLSVRLRPFLVESCGDGTWQLKRFPTTAEALSLDYRLDPSAIEDALPVAAHLDSPEEAGVWVLPPPPAQSSRGEASQRSDSPAIEHLRAAEYSGTGYFGNEGCETDFYVYAALEVTVPPAWQRSLVGDEGPSEAKAETDRAAIEAIIAGGPRAAMAALQALLDAGGDAQSTSADAGALAQKLADEWPAPGRRDYDDYGEERPARAIMLELLSRVERTPSLGGFIERVILRDYDGRENAELAAALCLLDPELSRGLAARLISAKVAPYPTACAILLASLIEALFGATPEDEAVCLEAAGAFVAALPDDRAAPPARVLWDDSPEPGEQAFLRLLFESLDTLAVPAWWERALSVIAASPARYPTEVLLPALTKLARTHPAAAWISGLWRIVVERLLERSERPVEPPQDWAEPVELGCKCGDCALLQAFLWSPTERVARFRVAKERRRHLHTIIDRGGCDLEHSTDRRGSPQTLVCTKTRARYQRRSVQRVSDLAFLSKLAELAPGLRPALAPLAARARAAGQLSSRGG